MLFFVKRFVFLLKIHVSFRYHFFIGLEFISLEHSFELSKQMIIIADQIYRIDWVQKRFEMWFMKFCHRHNRLLTRCIFFVKEHFVLLHFWPFSAMSSFKHTKNCYVVRTPKTYMLLFATFVDLDGFPLLLSPQLTANVTLELCGGSTFHPLSHIFEKKPNLFVAFKLLETMLWIFDVLLFLIDLFKHGTHLKHSFLIDKCSCKRVKYTAFWYLHLLYHHTQVQFTNG